MILEPGEARRWHVDQFHRVTVVVRGSALALAVEYREDSKVVQIEITPGQTDWDAPTDKVHRAVNVGKETYEEVAIFFLDRHDAVPQPSA